MISTEPELFGRLITAMITPFQDSGGVDTAAVEHIVNHLIATGTDSIVVNGTTGESPTLSKNEKSDLLKLVLSASNGAAKVIMGTGSNSTEHTIEESIQAQKAGADGVLVVAPYYNKPSQDGLLAHFEAVASSIDVPLIIYNIPGRTGINVNAQTVVKLSHARPNIVGLKESTGTTDQAAEIAGAAAPGFKIYSGDDYMTLPLMAIGACGVVSVASHLIGKEIKQMVTSFAAGKLDEAREINYRCLPMFKGLFVAPNPTCVKFGLSLCGLCRANLRLPLVELSIAQQEEMRRLLSTYNLDVSEPSTTSTTTSTTANALQTV